MAAVHKQTIRLLEQLHRRVTALEMNTTRLTALHGKSVPTVFKPNPDYDLLEQLRHFYDGYHGVEVYIKGNSVHIDDVSDGIVKWDSIKVILSVADERPGMVHVWIRMTLPDKYGGSKEDIKCNKYVAYADLSRFVQKMTDGDITPCDRMYNKNYWDREVCY